MQMAFIVLVFQFCGETTVRAEKLKLSRPHAGLPHSRCPECQRQYLNDRGTE